MLMLLVSGPGIEVDAAVKLNHLLHRVERWTDLLLGYLGGLGEVGDLGHQPRRARNSPKTGSAKAAQRAAGLVAGAGLPAVGVSPGPGPRQPQRRLEPGHRLRNPASLPNELLRFDRPIPVAVALAALQSHQQRRGDDRDPARPAADAAAAQTLSAASSI